MPRRSTHQSFYVYIIASPSRTLYIGVTNDPNSRVAEHREGTGSRFAAKYHVTRLVYLEEFSNPLEAIDRETALKRWRREKKIKLIESENPTWRDLSEED
jgi:putative endonuclease